MGSTARTFEYIGCSIMCCRHEQSKSNGSCFGQTNWSNPLSLGTHLLEPKNNIINQAGKTAFLEDQRGLMGFISSPPTSHSLFTQELDKLHQKG